MRQKSGTDQGHPPGDPETVFAEKKPSAISPRPLRRGDISRRKGRRSNTKPSISTASSSRSGREHVEL